MFKVLYSYTGWQNANYVLNDVKNPVRTLKIAGPLALGITATLYIFANIAYFAYVSRHTSGNAVLGHYLHSASSKRDILESGTAVAPLFFKNVFGAQAQRALSAFVALRCVSLAHS
jgi:solute carrier family 7 (L-type amino acid transporter), member 9/15